MELIKKYFYETEDNKPGFNEPATIEEIAELENKFQIKLPEDYKQFLLFTNGFTGYLNEFVVDFEKANKIFQATQDNSVSYFPWAIYIGTNGGGEMFVIDIRHQPYQFGLLPDISDESDFIPLGDTFEKFIKRLHGNTAFKEL